MKPATVNGSFTTQNPHDGKFYSFEMNKIGWLSTTGFFHFGKKVPEYAKRKAFELFLSRFDFLKGYC